MLTKDLFDQIVAVLLPEMGDAQARKALIESALYNCPALQKIQWDGAARPFTVQLTRLLDQYGEVAPGRPAIVTVLEEVKAQVGADRWKQIDDLVVKLNDLRRDFNLAAPAPNDLLSEFRRARIAEWSAPRYYLDKRFVNLTLLLDKGETEPQRWHRAEDFRFNDLRDVLEKTKGDPALALLGAPGSGKSTLLRRLQLDHSSDRLRDGAEDVSFFVQLNGYRARRRRAA